MPLPVFDTQDDVPEAFREHYEERDGKWAPKAQEPKAGDDDLRASVKRLEGAIEAERQLRKDAEAAAREADRKARELEQKGKAGELGITDEKLKELRDQVRADLDAEYSAKYGDYDDVKGENRTLKLDNRVRSIAAKSGVRSDRLDAWWKQHGDRFDLTDDGTPMVRDNPGREIEKFIADDLKKELPDFYEGTQAAGGGAGGIQRNGQFVTGTSAEDVLKNPTAAVNAARQAGAN